MLSHRAIILVTLAGLSLSGCITLGDDFALENAAKVKNGMTREQVIALMGSEPSSMEGTDEGKLLWIYSWTHPFAVGTEMQRVSFSFDEHGRVYGVQERGPSGHATN